MHFFRVWVPCGMAEPNPSITVAELVDFIENKMRMSHIYQPLLIQSLVESGGQATLRELAVKFLTEEEAEIREMMKTIKKMPVHVLSAKNKSRKKPIVEEEDGVVRLLVKPADLKERAEILGACAHRLHDYVAKRGEGIWDHKWLDSPAGGSMRFKVLEAGGRRCALCGITSKDRALDVDHIVPHSKGGPSTFENLQILCSKCNRSKGQPQSNRFPRCRTARSRLSRTALLRSACAQGIPLRKRPCPRRESRSVGHHDHSHHPQASRHTVTWTSPPTRSSPCTTCCALRWDGYMTVRSLRLGQMK